MTADLEPSAVMMPDQIARLPYRPCVGIMLANRDGNVFVGQRIDSTAEAWQMPQGGVEPGEVPRDAALRELREETGIVDSLVRIEAEAPAPIPYDLPPDLVAKLWRGRYRGQEQRWFLMRYLGTDAQIDIATAEPEFAAWQWLPPADLAARIVPFKRAVYASVLQQFGPLLIR